MLFRSAYGKAFVADVIVTLSRKATEKATGFGRLFLAKSRAGKDGIVFPVHINTARSKFKIIGDSGSFEEAKSENESEMKKRLKEKWKELKDDS